MAEFLGTLDLLNLVYLVLLAIGFIYALLILLGQGIGELDLPGLDAGDVPSFDHGEIGLPSLSPMSLASFITAFGAFGLVSSQLFDASAGISLLFAAGGGLVVGIIFKPRRYRTTDGQDRLRDGQRPQPVLPELGGAASHS